MSAAGLHATPALLRGPGRAGRGRQGVAFGLLAVALAAAPLKLQADPPAPAWDEKIEVAAGGGHKGPWRMNESEYDYVDDPTVAISEQGHVGVAWADQPRLDVFLQVYAPDGTARLEAPVNVSRSPRTFSWLPRMVVATADAREVYLLWQEIIFSGGSHGGEIFFARSRDGGRTFGDPVNLSNSIAGDGKGRLTRRYWSNGSLDLAMGPEGHLYAAWTDYDGDLWFRRSTDKGESFSDRVRVAGGEDAAPARGPSLAVDAEGAVYLAWTVGEDEAADIRFATSADQGRSFGAPRIVFDSGGHSDAPKVAVDGEGTVHLVYAESPTGPFERYHIRYTRLRRREPAFEAPRAISGAQMAAFESVGYPALGLDGDDHVYVIWELFPRRKGYPRGLGFTYSRDGGRTFAASSVIPGSRDPLLGVNGSLQGLLMRKLAVNRAGTLAVVNSTFERNRASHIWLFRGRAAGP